jgi:putative tryptophan/tyrosine transport system substrate-binding protein
MRDSKFLHRKLTTVSHITGCHFLFLWPELNAKFGVVPSLGEAMRRRDFVNGIAGSTVTWPLTVRAQQNVTPAIGYLSFRPLSTEPHYLAAFREGLGAQGFVEGQNVSIVFRWADNKADRLPELAADLARQQLAAIAAPTPLAALAAKRATQTIPIVFTSGSDPVQIGLVTSLNRPGGNVTGFYFLLVELVGKRLALLRELLPRAKRIALLVNPKNVSDAQPTVRQATAAARNLGFEIEVFNASTAEEIAAVFAGFENRRPDALFIGPDPLFNPGGMQAARASSFFLKLPTSAFNRELAEAGCLMSYGPDIKDSYRQAGVYIGRILKGEKPGDLPVTQPTKYELVMNLKTAKALGLTVPPTLLALADEIIE